MKNIVLRPPGGGNPGGGIGWCNESTPTRRESGGGSGGRVLEENGRHATLIVPVAINKGLRATISLKKGNSVQLIGLGTFSATAPKKVAKFKAGKALADTVK